MGRLHHNTVWNSGVYCDDRSCGKTKEGWNQMIDEDFLSLSRQKYDIKIENIDFLSLSMIKYHVKIKNIEKGD